MFQIIRKLIPQSVVNVLKSKPYETIEEWQKNGSPLPPPHIVKQSIIKEYQQKYGYKILIETGTYLGDMVEAQKQNFNKIHSIELSNKLYLKAKKRFRNDENIYLYEGDSGKVLRSIMPLLNESSIFWLDGHYSAGITAKGEKICPIFEELDSILISPYKHILLIDDARLFTGKDDYPTIDELNQYLISKSINYDFEIKWDTIRVVLN